MSDSLSINDLQSGGKSWGGEGFVMGDKVSGEVISAKRVQQTDFQTGDPLFWSNGDPRMMSQVTIQTDLRDGEDDDGVRTLYLKGGNFEAKEGVGAAGERALVEAMKAAGATSVDPGGKLHVAISGIAKPTTRGYQPAKLWSMKYEPPTQSIAAADLWDE